MNKNEFATTPPMGWNSYDYYDTAVTEEEVLANAKYMEEHLKPYGWDYVVVDIEWYAYGAGSIRSEFQYIPFAKVEMDEYSRLLPCVERFPSAVGGKGFAPLAEKLHEMGLKFGIHIMRGIPRMAAHNHGAIKGTDVTADRIAEASNICFWNPDMYGLRTDVAESQLYYDSLFELYAQWGVDFVKCDDICRMDMPTAKEEIVMLHRAIEKCGRPIVLSLSPGPAKLDEAWHYEKYANMWRITDDFWDDWKLLFNMFERCEHWMNHVKKGCYPDCDMLPVGKLGKGHGNPHDTGLSKAEQRTMISLWSIFRSPMMLGCDCTQLDDWTLELLTNKEVLQLLKIDHQAIQLERDENHAIWMNVDPSTGVEYLAVFNLSEEKKKFDLELSELGFSEKSTATKVASELWSKENVEIIDGCIKTEIASHDVKIFSIV